MIEINKSEIDLENWFNMEQILPEQDREYRVLYYIDHPGKFECGLLYCKTGYDVNLQEKFCNWYKNPYSVFCEKDPDFWQQVYSEKY